MMTKKQFIQRVQWVGHFDSENQAEKAIHNVLELLARRLTATEAGRLWHHLPRGMELSVRHEKEHEIFSLDEFIDMLAAHEGVTYPVAEHHAEAVAGVLQENISARELEEMFSLLPADYGDFFKKSRERSLSSR